MFSRNRKQTGILGKCLAVALCLLFVACGIPLRAEAAATEQGQDVNKMIQDWESRYGKSGYWTVSDPAGSKNEGGAKSGGESSPLPQDANGFQTERFRNKVKSFIHSYDILSGGTVSGRYAFDPWFQKGHDRFHINSINGQK